MMEGLAHNEDGVTSSDGHDICTRHNAGADLLNLRLNLIHHIKSPD